MLQFLRYLFWPNPGFAAYTDVDMLGLLGLCVLLIVASFALSFWRRKQSNPLTRKLSASWASVAFWFGLVGVVLVVARVEDIQFLAMRFLWVLWAVLLLAYVFLQARVWRARHYEILPTETRHDPRDAYLPRGKRRR